MELSSYPIAHTRAHARARTPHAHHTEIITKKNSYSRYINPKSFNGWLKTYYPFKQC